MESEFGAHMHAFDKDPWGMHDVVSHDHKAYFALKLCSTFEEAAISSVNCEIK